MQMPVTEVAIASIASTSSPQETIASYTVFDNAANSGFLSILQLLRRSMALSYQSWAFVATCSTAVFTRVMRRAVSGLPCP